MKAFCWLLLKYQSIMLRVIVHIFKTNYFRGSLFNENNVQKSQEYIDRLIAILDNREAKSAKLNDIIDVLRQVSKNLPTAKNPEALVMRLINYIRSVSMAGRLHYSKEEENLIINLEMIGQKVGLNGQYMADFGDKSQFYSIFEQIPKH